MLKTLNDIRTGNAFRHEKLTTTEPYVERTIPEYPVWMKQPEPGSIKLHAPGPDTRADLVIYGLVALAFVGMAVL